MLIRDGFSSTVRRATQEGRESFEVAQQSCRRKDARSSGVNFPDSALAGAAAGEDRWNRFQHDAQVEQQRPVVNVLKIQIHPALEVDLTPS